MSRTGFAPRIAGSGESRAGTGPLRNPLYNVLASPSRAAAEEWGLTPAAGLHGCDSGFMTVALTHPPQLWVSSAEAARAVIGGSARGVRRRAAGTCEEGLADSGSLAGMGDCRVACVVIFLGVDPPAGGLFREGPGLATEVVAATILMPPASPHAQHAAVGSFETCYAK
eukprot:CAMPEP_0172699336 /NCGR_PEP_ID=MMETSP1074-20121228/30110_1 /TAXON_ID=2916 /ORGANISM="Ceratium fusus, Strain PA161109" /LENGTH=168 /DNA_ID=CAMNT_0013520515 /DNA_START=239 /DNA_END=743 /DNA_ORIENTATION=-